MPCLTIDTPTGPLSITEDSGAIIRVEWGGETGCDDTPLLHRARTQIDEYFAGTRTEFDLPLRVQGSDFQQAVCAAMSAIPFGETVTYTNLRKE